MSAPVPGPPPLLGLLESALYVDDLDRAEAFYRDLFGLARLSGDERLRALAMPGGTTLLLFRRGATLRGVALPGGAIPPHDGSGPAHLAFAVPADALERWAARLERHGVAIESRVTWRSGERSLYVRDPDGHSLELATPGVWGTRDPREGSAGGS